MFVLEIIQITCKLSFINRALYLDQIARKDVAYKD
jgi:hypothetical protein